MKAWEVRSGRLGLHTVDFQSRANDEVPVQVRYAGICGSDRPKLMRPNDFALPEFWRPGHEIVGTDPEGRSIAVDPLVPCGHCRCCDVGDTHLCPDLQRLGWDLPGGFAEQVLAPATNIHAIPEGLDPLHAVLADPAAVAIHGLRCNPIGEPGRLAVIGAGTVGLLTALYAHEQGWMVTVIYRRGSSPAPAVTAAIPADFHSPSHATNSKMFDVVVDAATGSDAAPIELALQLVRDGGAVVVQNAYHPGVALPTPLREVFRRSIRLIGSFSYCRQESLNDFTLALSLLGEHAQQTDYLVANAGRLTDLEAILDSPPRWPARCAIAVQ